MNEPVKLPSPKAHLVAHPAGGEKRGKAFRHENDTTFITDYVFLFREGNQPAKVEYDQHIVGLFPRDEWLSLLSEAGFRANFVMDSFDRHVFVARKY